MRFTSERLYPELTPPEIKHVLYEHLSRYEFACKYAEDRQVLDAACGSGYGSIILYKTGRAKKVTGVDLSHEAIREAKKRDKSGSVNFRIGNVTHLKFIDEEFDEIVSFETIEHVPDGRKWLSEANRLLKKDGILIISTPNRKITSQGQPYDKPFHPYHFVEYTHDEFIKELSSTFKIMEFYGQCFKKMWWINFMFRLYNIRALKPLLYYCKKVKIKFIRIIEKRKHSIIRKMIERYWIRNSKLSLINDLREPTYFIAVCKKI